MLRKTLAVRRRIVVVEQFGEASQALVLGDERGDTRLVRRAVHTCVMCNRYASLSDLVPLERC